MKSELSFNQSKKFHLKFYVSYLMQGKKTPKNREKREAHKNTRTQVSWSVVHIAIWDLGLDV